MRTQIGSDSFLQSLHFSIKRNLIALTIHAEQVVVCHNADGFSAHFHFSLGSYAAVFTTNRRRAVFKKKKEYFNSMALLP